MIRGNSHEATGNSRRIVMNPRILIWLLAILLLDSSLVLAAESVIYKVPDATGKFCHLRFPAIKEETLSWDRPVLKDPSQGDIIDFYGPCNYDPLGKEEIRRQKDDYERRQRRLPESEGA